MQARMTTLHGWSKALLLVVLASAVVGCDRNPGNQDLVQGRDGYWVTDVASLPDGVLFYLSRSTSSSDGPAELWVQKGGADPQLLYAFDSPGLDLDTCDPAHVLSLSPYDDHHVAAVVECQDGDGRRVVSIGADGATTDLGRAGEAYDIAWQLRGSEAVVQLGQSGCESMRPFLRGRVEPWPQVPPLGWDLNEVRADCSDHGEAAYPSVSAEGRVAFLAKVNSNSDSFEEREGQPWTLCVMNLDGTGFRKVAEGFTHPFAVSQAGDIV